MTDIDTRALDRELKRGSAERLILEERGWAAFVNAVRRVAGDEHA